VSIIRRINCIDVTSGICHCVCRWKSGMQEHMLLHNSFSCMFISILYMFRTSMCPPSGELIVSMWHLVYVTVCRWPSGMQEHVLKHSSFSCMFISILYIFRTAMCPSSGELIVSRRHLVYVTVCRWPSGMQEHMLLHNSFSCMFISILYMFRTAMCSPSGELIVSMWHLV